MIPRVEGRSILVGLAVLVPGALTFWLAFHEGGYFPGPVGLVAVEVAILLALSVVIGRVPWNGLSIPLAIALCALGALAYWTLHSQTWSDAPARAMTEYDRVILYLLVLAFFGSLGFTPKRMRVMLYGLAAAIVAVCVTAFIARTLPEIITYDPEVHPERLSYPISYWNSLGILSAVGLILCGHLSCSTRDHWLVRVLAAASIPLLAATLYYTFSRGATWLALAGVALYVILGRPRGLPGAAIATVPTTIITMATVNPAGVLTRDYMSPAAIDAGERIALTVGLCMLAAAVLRAVMLPLDKWLVSLALPTRMRRPVLATATVGTVAVVVAGCAAVQAPSLIADKYDEFNAGEVNVPKTGLSRLTTATSNGRQDHWDVANAAYEANSGRGTGAGTWGIEWSRERPNKLWVQDAHSLYLEVRSELGLPGLILVAAALLLIAGAFLFRMRGPDKAMFAALFAAALAWGTHAGIDWDWEMAVVTLWLFAAGGLALSARPSKATPHLALSVPIKVAVVAACVAVAILPMRMAVSEARVDAGVDAATNDRCKVAIAEARSSLDAVPERALPYQVIGCCELRLRHADAARRAYQRAVERDPRNWELHRDLSVAQALSGRDPRPTARRAKRLNPLEDEVVEGVAAFSRADNPREWRRVALSQQIHRPGAPTP